MINRRDVLIRIMYDHNDQHDKSNPILISISRKMKRISLFDNRKQLSIVSILCFVSYALHSDKLHGNRKFSISSSLQAKGCKDVSKLSYQEIASSCIALEGASTLRYDRSLLQFIIDEFNCLDNVSGKAHHFRQFIYRSLDILDNYIFISANTNIDYL